jgi:hypothetical protein
MTDDAPAPPKRQWGRLLYVPPVVLLILFSIANAAAEPSDSGSESAGQFVGALFVPLAIGLVLRLLYVKVLVRRWNRPFWSPWIFAIAAVLALLVACGRVASRESDPQRRDARRAVEAASGSHSGNVLDCVEGALEAYDNRGQRPAPLPRPQAERLFVRVCQTAEREGFERYEDLSEARLTALVQRVVREMRASGELPPA